MSGRSRERAVVMGNNRAGRRGEGEVCCEAQFTIGLFDLTARRLVRPTPEWVKGLGLRPGDLTADNRGK